MTEENQNHTEEVSENTETQEQAQTQTETHSEQKENWIPKSRFDQINQQKKEYENTLKEVADSFKEDIPEEYREIIPDLPPKQQIEWVKAAKAKGLFTAKAQDGPDSETPGPSNQEVDTSNLSAFDKMRSGFN